MINSKNFRHVTNVCVTLLLLRCMTTETKRVCLWHYEPELSNMETSITAFCLIKISDTVL